MPAWDSGCPQTGDTLDDEQACLNNRSSTITSKAELDTEVEASTGLKPATPR
jgi:hypothetical protein